MAGNDGTRAGKVALVLGGGGITGGVYEMGVLKALDEFLINRSVNELDIYVGVSAGALVAAGMAAGLAPRRLVSVLSLGKGPFPPFRRADLYTPNWKEYGKRLQAVPGALMGAAWHSLWPLRDDQPVDLVESLTRVVPSGLFSNAPLGIWMEKLLAGAGLPTTWEGLNCELYLPALNLDTGHLTVFGEVGTRHMSLGKAVCASSAIPFVFQPVEIDGQEFVDGGMDANLPIDIAIRHGASLVIAVHPLVPLLNLPIGGRSGAEGLLSARGGTTVLDQVYRTLVHGRERDRIVAVRDRYPEIPILLIEPSFDDSLMFQFNVMRYSVRRQLAQHGYATTRRMLLSEKDEWREAFGKHGITVRDQIPETPSLDPEHEGGPRLDWNTVLDALERIPWVRERWGARGDS